jgi:hypothetical protein
MQSFVVVLGEFFPEHGFSRSATQQPGYIYRKRSQSNNFSDRNLSRRRISATLPLKTEFLLRTGHIVA